MDSHAPSKRDLLKSSAVCLTASLLPLASAKAAERDAAQPAESSRQAELTKGWSFRQAGSGAWLPAQVPGTVHTDLLASKRIADPFYRTNERDQQWIDKVDWEYRSTIEADAAVLAHDRVELVFDGLDTYADVYLNDALVLTADNMFLVWTLDAKPHLKPGANTLRVRLRSPATEGLKRLAALGYNPPATNDQSETGGLGDAKVMPFTRKAGYHYGWDWGPRLLTSGIWRPVRLRWWNTARIVDLHIVQNAVTAKAARLTAVVEIESESDQETTVAIRADGRSAAFATQAVSLKRGLNTARIDFTVANPKLWWTNGLGEAFLYSFEAQLRSGARRIDSRVVPTGLRDLKLVQTPDTDGASFHFELNGVPVFMKGANMIPNDSFLPRVTRATHEAVVNSAVESHMNMLRVWGGGIYEDDYFYELCDQHGILVWQDFMFACAMYPGDAEFLENVRREAVHNVRRLRGHACIALWCGNNEIDTAWQADVPNGGWGWKQKYAPAQVAEMTRAYEAIFHQILPAAVAQNDAGKSYWSSSPMTKEAGHADVTAAKQSGDIHYWDVWWGQKPFAEYRVAIGRFMSEYGFQSFPEFRTVQAYTEPGDHDIFSEVMKAHQRSSIGNGTIKAYMERDYRVPADFRQFLYVGQVLQAEGIKVAMEAHRSRMPYCMGSLFWQINDCWPVASWSSIDYFGRWKAQQFFAKKAFAAVLVSTVLEGDRVKIQAVSDLAADRNASLSVRVMGFDGRVLAQRTIPVILRARSSQQVLDDTAASLLGGADPATTLLVATLAAQGRELSRNILYFRPVKDLSLPKPNIVTSVRSVGDELALGLKTDQLVKNLHLDAGDGRFSDNYFDLLPGETTIVQFRPAKQGAQADAFKASLAMTHMAQVHG